MTVLLPETRLSASRVRLLREAFTGLLSALDGQSGFDIRPVSEFALPLIEGYRRLSIRCDMAGDPAWTLPLARHAARHGLPLTVNAVSREASFDQNGWLEELIAAGPEIGLKFIPWLGAECSAEAGLHHLAHCVARIRGRHVALCNLDFAPPSPGLSAEGFELFRGYALGGRESARMSHGADLSLQRGDLGSLGLKIIRPGRPGLLNLAERETYFASVSGLAYSSQALWRGYYGHRAAWEWVSHMIFTPNEDGTWTRYLVGTNDPPETHGSIWEIIQWLPGAGPEVRAMFLFDPRLLDESQSQVV